MRTVTLEIPGTPPSYNRTAHAHWSKVRKVKQEWQGFCETALMVARVPRNLEFVEASAKIYFKQRRRRDEGNFRVVLEKVLGDGLVRGKWLPDDVPEHYRFGAVECLAPHPSPHVEILLTFR